MSQSPLPDTHQNPADTGLRHSLAVRWTRFRDLGAGALFLVFGGLIAIFVIVAVVIGSNSSPQPHACDQARATVEKMEGLTGPLTAQQAAQLHRAAPTLSSYADKARGDEAKAVNDAAALAAGAQAGHTLDTSHLSIEFGSVCSKGGGGGEGSRSGM